MTDRQKIQVMQNNMADTGTLDNFDIVRAEDEPYVIITNKANGKTVNVPLFAAKEVVDTLRNLL